MFCQCVAPTKHCLYLDLMLSIDGQGIVMKPHHRGSVKGMRLSVKVAVGGEEWDDRMAHAICPGEGLILHR